MLWIVGDPDNDARPLTFMERDDPIGFRDVSDGCLRSLGEVPDEGAYRVEGSPSTWEIVRVEVRVD